MRVVRRDDDEDGCRSVTLEMKRSILLTFLTIALCGLSVSGQRLFEKYQFEDGGYALLGIFVHHSDHPLQKKVGEFYSDDVQVLNAIKRAWVFNKPQRQYACGYHYEIIILQHGVRKESFAINLECNELVTPDGSRYFDLKKISAFASALKPVRNEKREFSTVKEARGFLGAVSKRSDFLYYWPPRWLEHEGEFRFRIQCPADLGKNCSSGEKSDAMLPRLRTSISAAYPDERFGIVASGGSSDGEAYFTVKGSKSLEEKFDLYDRWGRTIFGKWEAYHLSFSWYSK